MNDPWTVFLAFASVLVMTGGLLLLAWRHGRLGIASTILFALAITAWVADVAAIASGFHDADGFVDCRDACTLTHRVAVLGFVAPPLLMSVGAAGMAIALVVRGRDRRRDA